MRNKCIHHCYTIVTLLICYSNFMPLIITPRKDIVTVNTTTQMNPLYGMSLFVLFFQYKQTMTELNVFKLIYIYSLTCSWNIDNVGMLNIRTNLIGHPILLELFDQFVTQLICLLLLTLLMFKRLLHLFLNFDLPRQYNTAFKLFF